MNPFTMERLVRTLYDWPLGTIVSIVMLCALGLLSYLIVLGTYVAIDSWFLTREKGYGRVVAKYFTPAHTNIILIYNAALKMSLPHPVYHPDNWSVAVDVEGRQSSTSVNQEYYHSARDNDQVIVEYVSGRLSGDMYIKALYRA